MLFINDIKALAPEIANLFNPKKLRSTDDIRGTCVYAYVREQTDKYGPIGSVYYIGEGNSCRPSGHHDNVVVPTEDHIYILNDGLTKVEARGQEAILISYFGRIKNGSGILLNKSLGSLRSFYEPHLFSEASPKTPRMITDSGISSSMFKHHKTAAVRKFIDEDWMC